MTSSALSLIGILMRPPRKPSNSLNQVRNLTEPHTARYLSKDLGPNILFNLADAPVSGAVTMAGNDHALVFTYETPIGQFEIAAPTLDEAGENRVSTCLLLLTV